MEDPQVALQHDKESQERNIRLTMAQNIMAMIADDKTLEYDISAVLADCKKLESWVLKSEPKTVAAEDPGEVSDGYHTFNEYEEFRMLYNAALFNELAASGKCDVHKSRLHHDGERPFGKDNYFVVAAMLPGGLITNHYDIKDWDLFRVPEVEKSLFEFDGHTSQDVVQRIRGFIAWPGDE